MRGGARCRHRSYAVSLTVNIPDWLKREGTGTGRREKEPESEREEERKNEERGERKENLKQ